MCYSGSIIDKNNNECTKMLTLAACMGTVQKTVPSKASMHEPQQLFLAIFMTILQRSIKSTRYEELCIHCSLKKIANQC